LKSSKKELLKEDIDEPKPPKRKPGRTRTQAKVAPVARG